MVREILQYIRYLRIRMLMFPKGFKGYISLRRVWAEGGLLVRISDPRKGKLKLQQLRALAPAR